MQRIEKTIALVDDDESVLHYLRDALTFGGYTCRPFSNGPAALEWLASGNEFADLLVTDVNMPEMNGFDMLRSVKTMSPDLPFIIVSGQCDLPMACGVLEAGASDYLVKPIAPDALLRAVSKHTELAPAERFDVAREILKVALRTASGASASDLTIEDRLQPIFNTLGFKRFETLQHSRRVAAYSLLIARDLGLDGRALRALAVGALLHDVGKAGIPHNVLFKPGILNDQEREIVKMHPQLGRELLAGLPDLNPEAQLVYSHHERFDGTGYPRQLAGDEIPLSARIFAVADTLDAITSDRCYRKGESVSAARAEIHRGAGSQFDPLVAELLDRITDEELETVRRQFPDAF